MDGVSMKVGDLVRQKYPVHLPTIGIVVEVCGRDALIKWTNCTETKRGQWHSKRHLWRIR